MRLRVLASICVALLSLAAPALAAPKASDLVKAELLVEPQAVKAGEAFTVGVRLRMAPRWHTYWQNPGDSGLATEIAWTLPEGFKAGPIEWPTPQRIPVSHLVNFGYEGETVLLTRITPPASGLPGRSIELAAHVSYLVCEKECIPGEAKLRATARVAGPGEAAGIDIAHRDAFDAARASLPVPSPWPHRVDTVEGSPVLKLEAPGLKAGTIRAATFFPYDETALEHAAPQTLSITNEGLSLALKRSALASGPLAQLDGVLVLDEALEGGTSRQAFALGRPPAGAAGTGASTVAGSGEPERNGLSLIGIAQAALFAFLGGLVLNLMPCVFPVLSIKVLSLAKHSGLSRNLVRLNGLAYTAGVVASFVALAGILLAIRAAGAEIGWGFQLQSPAFVAGLAFLMLALGLNLSGVAEFGTSLGRLGGLVSSGSGLSASFLTGVLATIVATPCTAPFMGAAIGYALTAPSAVAFAVFVALGLGMASPFLLLTVAPGLVSRLPRPGPWMETLKQVLAFPLYATAAWLVFVLSQQVGPSGLLAALFGLVLVGFGAWTLRLGTLRAGWVRRAAYAGGIAALIGVAAALAAVDRDRSAPGVATASQDGVQPFTQARLDTLRAEGRPVFVNFTAAWCITCAVNERVALSGEAVKAEMRARNVVYLKGDWTNQNPEITRVLEKNGRSGVPLYLLYSGQGEAIVLPQILTEGVVLESLGRIGTRPDRRADTARPNGGKG